MSHGTTAMLVKMWHRKSTIKEFAWRNIWKYSNKNKKLFLGFTFILENPDTAFLPYLDFLLKYTCYLFCLCLYSMIAGRAEGEKIGEARGKAIGRSEGRLEGKSEERADIILKMHKKGYSLEQIMDVTEMSEAEIKAIIE